MFLFRSSFKEIRIVFKTLKQYSWCLTFVYLCSYFLYPQLLNNYDIFVNNPINEGNTMYTYHFYTMSFIFYATQLLGTIISMLPGQLTKKSLLSWSVLRMIFFCIFLAIMNISGNVLIMKDSGSLVTSFQYLLSLINLISTIILGFTQGLFTAQCLVNISLIVEERVGTSISLLIMSCSTIVGVVLQVLTIWFAVEIIGFN